MKNIDVQFKEATILKRSKEWAPSARDCHFDFANIHMNQGQCLASLKHGKTGDVNDPKHESLLAELKKTFDKFGVNTIGCNGAFVGYAGKNEYGNDIFEMFNLTIR